MAVCLLRKEIRDEHLVIKFLLIFFSVQTHLNISLLCFLRFEVTYQNLPLEGDNRLYLGTMTASKEKDARIGVYVIKDRPR